MRTAESEEFTFQTDCTAKSNSPQNSNSSCQSKNSNEKSVNDDTLLLLKKKALLFSYPVHFVQNIFYQHYNHKNSQNK
jgi:hypothetical protein